MVFSSYKSHSQCPDGQIVGSTAYDTTIVFGSGIVITDKAELIWTESKDLYSSYHYEAEVSRDGHNFTNISIIPKNTTNTDPYRLKYTAMNEKKGVYSFRIKQVYSNGYTRFSDIKSIDLESSGLPKFNFYPNPSNGIVGIKFADNFDGKLFIRIFNMQGQAMVNKEILVSGASYYQIAVLQKGMYWLKLADVTGKFSCVNQLLIK